MTFVPWGRMDDFYAAVVQSVEEAVLNALVVNDDMVGRDGHRSPRLPIDRLIGADATTPWRNRFGLWSVLLLDGVGQAGTPVKETLT